jgi:hypothetical protein
MDIIIISSKHNLFSPLEKLLTWQNRNVKLNMKDICEIKVIHQKQDKDYQQNSQI